MRLENSSIFYMYWSFLDVGGVSYALFSLPCVIFCFHVVGSLIVCNSLATSAIIREHLVSRARLPRTTVKSTCLKHSIRAIPQVDGLQFPVRICSCPQVKFNRSAGSWFFTRFEHPKFRPISVLQEDLSLGRGVGLCWELLREINLERKMPCCEEPLPSTPNKVAFRSARTSLSFTRSVLKWACFVRMLIRNI